MKKILFSALTLMFTPAMANAALLVAIDVNGTQACASDNNTGCTFGSMLTDVNPAVGVISLDPLNVGGLLITGSTQEAFTTGGLNILNTSSTQVTNISGGTLTGTVAVSSTNYVPPVSQAFVSGSATWQDAIGSSILMSWFNDPTNQQGAETAMDTPGLLLSSCQDAVGLVADSTACAAGPIPVSDLLPFSMTLYSQFTLVSGATLVNRGQTEIKPVVPEPATLVLLGLGLLGAGFMRRRSIEKQ